MEPQNIMVEDAFKTADEAMLRTAVQQANIPALMMSLLHLEGDDGIMSCGIAPNNIPLNSNEDGLTNAQRETIRDRAVEAALNWRQSGQDLFVPDADILDRATTFISGQDTPATYGAMLREELPFAGPNRPAWGEGLASEQDRAAFPIIVIGAGMSGIVAGIRLKQAGYPFVIIEKSSSVGGTWRNNDYPGCRVDTPNHIYSYSFASDFDWPARFSDRATLRRYFEDVAAQFGLKEHLRLNTEVTGAEWDENTGAWDVHLKGGERIRARAVISALGQLNRPKVPNIPGLASFDGAQFHSARWDHSVDLKGKRVAVIGTGASATQFVPEIADQVAQMTILQRSPPWLVPTPDYHDALSEDERWLMRNWPAYATWYRMWLFRRDGVEGVLPMLFSEPGFDGKTAVSAGNAAIRDLWVDYIKEQAGHDPAWVKRLLPDYPPCAKRPLRDSGTWVKTLQRDDVALVQDPIAAIEPNGVRLGDGTLIEVDVIVFGTGFEADRFFAPLDITGRGGAKMADAMENPRAYRGTLVPGFPNFFSIYGPNTNTVVGAGIIFFSECAMRYVTGCLNFLSGAGHKSLEIKPEPFETYNAWIDQKNNSAAWGMPDVDSWYKNDAGRVTQNWPGTHYEFWEMTLRPEPDHFDVR